MSIKTVDCVNDIFHDLLSCNFCPSLTVSMAFHRKQKLANAIRGVKIYSLICCYQKDVLKLCLLPPRFEWFPSVILWLNFLTLPLQDKKTTSHFSSFDGEKSSIRGIKSQGIGMSWKGERRTGNIQAHILIFWYWFIINKSQRGSQYNPSCET